MANVKFPRSGSLQFWPRVRAKRQYPVVKSWAQSKEVKLQGFAGYKVGMMHAITTIVDPLSKAKKTMEKVLPLTIIECPSMKIASIKLYKNGIVKTEIINSKLDKELAKKIKIPKKATKKIEDIKPEEYDDIKITIYTQPKQTGIGKKKPEVFEVAIGGSVEEKINFAKENMQKEITIKDVFTEGQSLDVHGVTKGKGTQGPVRRFGIHIRQSKSEKTKRGPGSLGPWCGQRHIMWRVPHAGKMGYHTRTEFNKQIIKIGEKPEEININGGITRYGVVKNNYVLVKGGVIGPKKRMVILTKSIRPNPKKERKIPPIKFIRK